MDNSRFIKELDGLIADLMQFRADKNIEPERLRAYVDDSIDIFNLYKNEPICDTDDLCPACADMFAGLEANPLAE